MPRKPDDKGDLFIPTLTQVVKGPKDKPGPKASGDTAKPAPTARESGKKAPSFFDVELSLDELDGPNAASAVSDAELEARVEALVEAVLQEQVERVKKSLTKRLLAELRRARGRG